MAAVRRGRGPDRPAQFDLGAAVHLDREDGALNLFGFESHAFGPEEEATVESFAAHAALALMAARTEEQLRSAVASRDVIGQAKGMLMERFDVDAIRAFEMLSALSQETNTRLSTIAQKVVEGR